MTPNFNRATRARIHAALLDVMPGENPTAEQAFCEIVAWNDTDGIDDLSTVLDLASKIDFHTYREIRRDGGEYAEVDASALGDLYTAGTLRLAMRLGGYRPLARVSGRVVIWTDAPEGETAAKVVLSQGDFARG